MKLGGDRIVLLGFTNLGEKESTPSKIDSNRMVILGESTDCTNKGVLNFRHHGPEVFRRGAHKVGYCARVVLVYAASRDQVQRSTAAICAIVVRSHG